MKSFIVGVFMERMVIDIMGELYIFKFGNKCIVVVMDYFIKFVFLIFLFDYKVKIIVEGLVKEVFIKMGIFRFFYFDRGIDFMFRLFREVCVIFRIDKIFIILWRL